MKTDKLINAVKKVWKNIELLSTEKDELIKWIKTAEIDSLYRINVFNLAELMGCDREILLKIFILLAGKEVFDINWDYHCPSCNMVAESHKHLAEAKADGECKLCNIKFRNTLDTNVEVTFNPSGAFFNFPQKFMDQKMMTMMEKSKKMENKLPDIFVSGLACLHIKEFRDLFEEDVLSYDESLVIKSICLLFTDIKGSTALYDRIGDTKAYRLIRKHFEIMFDIIPKFGGMIIKTIGDAVMASFKSSKDGVAAAIEIHKAFKVFDTEIEDEKEMLIKMGLHSGPTIMVTLNKSVDYFGQTVNMAARVQAQARGGQILISSKIRKNREVLKLMKGEIKSLLRKSVELKGIEGKNNLFILNFDN